MSLLGIATDKMSELLHEAERRLCENNLGVEGAVSLSDGVTLSFMKIEADWKLAIVTKSGVCPLQKASRLHRILAACCIGTLADVLRKNHDELLAEVNAATKQLSEFLYPPPQAARDLSEQETEWPLYEVDTDDVALLEGFDGVTLMTGEVRADGIRMSRETARTLGARLIACANQGDGEPPVPESAPDEGASVSSPLSRDVVHQVYEDGANVLYFKRIASDLVSDHAALLRDDWVGGWQVVRQTATARVSLRGANAHRKVVGEFATEREADAFLRSKVPYLSEGDPT